MTDPVAKALREIVPVTRGRVDLADRRLRRHWTALQAELAAEHAARHVVAVGSGHAMLLDRPALVAEAILGCAQ